MKRTISEQLIEAANQTDMGRKPDKKDYRRIAAAEITNLTKELQIMNTNYQILMLKYKEVRAELKKLKEQK